MRAGALGVAREMHLNVNGKNFSSFSGPGSVLLCGVRGTYISFRSSEAIGELMSFRLCQLAAITEPTLSGHYDRRY